MSERTPGVLPTPDQILVLLLARDGAPDALFPPRWCVVAESLLVRGWLGSREGERPAGPGVVWNGHLVHVTREGRAALSLALKGGRTRGTRPAKPRNVRRSVVHR